jgi:cysteine-rich repeat protein
MRLRSLATGVAAALLVASLPGPVLAGVGPTQQCDITVGLDGANLLGALELRLDYSAAGGVFVGPDESVFCIGLGEGSLQSARNDVPGQELDLGLLSVAGVLLPQDLWRCTFETSSGVPSAGNFHFTVDDALDPDFATMAVTPSITGIACDTQAVCGNGIVEGLEECDTGGATTACDATCHLTRDSQRCHISFHVSGATSIGGIQFAVDYSAAGGQFEGSGIAVSCRNTLATALTAADDRDADKELRLALVAVPDFPLPDDLWDCEFLTSATVLQLGSLVVKNIVATDQSLGTVPVVVAPVTEGCTFGPYCGDGFLDPSEACDDGNRVDTDNCTNACQVATCGDGSVHAGVEQCDDGNATSGDCCSPSCMFEAATTVCRAAVGICDLAENCTGASGTCPADAKKTTVCRAAVGICDIAEVCSGSSDACPADVKSTAVCRAATGVCDLTETCNGTASTCPGDAFQPSSTACASDGNPCTDDKCDGAGSCGHPGNSASCNDGLFCNGADTCSGGTCSLHAGNPCVGPDNDSNCKESCSEANDNCSANDPDGSTCNDGNSSTSNDQCLSGACIGGSTSVVCGDADSSGTVTSSDALRVLKTAVGQPGTCPLNRCDTDHNGSITSSDALRVLRKAVGQPVDLSCPA